MIYNTTGGSRRYIYKAKLSKPRFLQRYKIERLNFRQQIMFLDNQWIEMIFSQKQKWNFDGSEE